MPERGSTGRAWRIHDWAAAAVCIAAATCFMVAWLHPFGGVPAFDIYSYYLPNMLYARSRFFAGGSGILWNEFQNCGQPFFGISSTGILYPTNLLFLFLDADPALHLVIAGNLVIAGVSMYLLARQVGVGRGAALCGALAFELGPATVTLSAWGPQMSGAHVWTPAALLFCERLLRSPSARSAFGLAAVLTLALLPGFPQSVFFTYQIIALRVLMEILGRRLARPWATLGWLAAGLALAPLLDAVQLLPSIEMVASSVRGSTLSADEIRGMGFLTWKALTNMMVFRYDQSVPSTFVPWLLASACWLRGATRRIAFTYGFIGALFFILAFGPATPLFGLYLHLPIVGLFREPHRFTWITSFCLALLTALGVDAIARGGLRRMLGAAICVAVALLSFRAIAPTGLRQMEWGLTVLVGGALLLAGRGTSLRRPVVALLLAACTINVLGYASKLYPLAINWYATRGLPPAILIPSETLFTYRDLFTSLSQRMTAQDRVYIVNRHPSFTLMPKTASLFAVPAIQDYEPQPTRRSAEFSVFLRFRTPLLNLNQYYYPLVSKFTPQFVKPLLDLAAARYVVVDREVDNAADVVRPLLQPLTASDDRQMTVYENAQARPRAFFVPRVSVLPDPAAILARLASPEHDPRTTALLETPPPSGFLGEPDSPPGGTADILAAAPEHVVVRVHAPARGFLHLADQYFPGWYATVNGAPAPILRANYLFRAVEVPAGESTVEFRYAPTSLRIGGAITAATLLALAAAFLNGRRTRAAGAAAGLTR